MQQSPVIGIDLGTTNSVVAVFDNGTVEVIQNDVGNRITPSVVTFTETERLVGEAAEFQAAKNPKNTIYSKIKQNLYFNQFSNSFDNLTLNF